MTFVEKLQDDYIKKDRGVRIAWVTFMMVVGLGVIVIMALQLVQLAAQRDQIAQQNRLIVQQNILIEQQKKSTDELKANTAEYFDRIIRHVDCIAHFFAQKDRTNSVIKDLDSCSIQAVPASQQQPAGSTSYPLPAMATQPAIQQPRPTQQAAPAPNPSSPGPDPNPQPQPTPQPTVLEKLLKLPQKLLGGL